MQVIKRLRRILTLPITVLMIQTYPRSIEKFPDYPLQVATSPFRSSHCYITFHAYSVIICIGINPQRISFNYSGKMAEQFNKY